MAKTFSERLVKRFDDMLGWEQTHFVVDCARLMEAAQAMIDAEPLTVEEMKARRELVDALAQCRGEVP